MFQGRTAADVVFTGEPPWIASFQAGAFRADLAAKHASGKAPVKAVSVDLKPDQIRTKPLELFREAKQAVDLTQAPILVSVGRGIKAPENIQHGRKARQTNGRRNFGVAPDLRRGLAADGAANRQLRADVAPKLYLALGISGAIQHVVGMNYAFAPANAGAPGVDGMTFAAIEALGLDGGWRACVKDSSDVPARSGAAGDDPEAGRRRATARHSDDPDRVVQTAAKLVLEPIFVATGKVQERRTNMSSETFHRDPEGSTPSR